MPEPGSVTVLAARTRLPIFTAPPLSELYAELDAKVALAHHH